MRILLSLTFLLATASFVSAQAPAKKAPAAPAMRMTVEGFPDGGVIPIKYTAFAPNHAPDEALSPTITWTNVPAGTQTFFLHMHDMENPRNKTTEDQPHWVFWNIPGTSTGLPEGVPKGSPRPDGSYQISASGPMYRGPGARFTGPFHHYMFELYALDTKLDVTPTDTPYETRANVIKAIQGHILGKAVYVGLFKGPAE